jgi:hypothetical protein
MTYNRNHVLALYRRLFPTRPPLLIRTPLIPMPGRLPGWHVFSPAGNAPKFTASSLAGLMATMRLQAGLTSALRGPLEADSWVARYGNPDR